ncbi:MAG: glutathione S-transferase N-terminal domain-containing protein [Myxococcota bacterium]
MSVWAIASASVTTILRGGIGMRVAHVGARPEKPLQVYEFEGCPFCRKVRESLTMLDLEAEIFPCPKGGERYRSVLAEIGGKQQFPFLVDPNTETSLYESGDIVDYLFAQYGTGPAPAALRGGPLATLAVVASGIGRGSAGTFVKPSKAPEKSLELYSFEASPFCRLVRERLSELEIPYRLHNVAKESARRSAFRNHAGKIQVPYLIDPNTDIEMFESADILAYLDATYGLSS